MATDSTRPLGELVFAWRTPTPAIEPELTLLRWQVVETNDGDWRVIGYCKERSEGRVSTSIEVIEVTQMRVKSASHRQYQLEGPPGCDPDAEAVWRRVKRARMLDETKDHSSQVWHLHKKASIGRNI